MDKWFYSTLYDGCNYLLTHCGRDIMAAISQTQTFNSMFLNENVGISSKISLKFVPKGPIYNIPSLVQIMTWRWPGDKPLSDPMMVWLLAHIYVSLGLFMFRSQAQGISISISYLYLLSISYLLSLSLSSDSDSDNDSDSVSANASVSAISSSDIFIKLWKCFNKTVIHSSRWPKTLHM